MPLLVYSPPEAPTAPSVAPMRRHAFFEANVDVEAGVDLSGITSTLQEAQEVKQQWDSWGAEIPGYNKGMVQNALLEGIRTGEVSSSTMKNLISTAFAVGAGAACSGTVALAPICAMAGGFVGSLVGDLFFSQKTEKSVSPEIAQYMFARDSDVLQIIYAKDKLQSEVVRLLGHDPIAKKEALAIVDMFYPKELVFRKDSDLVFETFPQVSSGPWLIYLEPQQWDAVWDHYGKTIEQAPMGPGFFLPYVSYCIIRGDYATTCWLPGGGPWFPPPPNDAIQVPYGQPGWVEKFYNRMAQIFAIHGIDMWPTVEFLYEKAVTEQRYGGGMNPVQQLFRVHEDIKLYFFPYIEKELRKRIEQVYIESAARLADRLVQKAYDLALQIAEQVGCISQKCIDGFLPFATEIIEVMDEIGQAQAEQKIAAVIAEARAHYKAIYDKYVKNTWVNPNVAQDLASKGYVFKPDLIIKHDVVIPPEFLPKPEPLPEPEPEPIGDTDNEPDPPSGGMGLGTKFILGGLVLGGLFLGYRSYQSSQPTPPPPDPDPSPEGELP